MIKRLQGCYSKMFLTWNLPKKFVKIHEKLIKTHS